MSELPDQEAAAIAGSLRAGKMQIVAPRPLDRPALARTQRAEAAFPQ